MRDAFSRAQYKFWTGIHGGLRSPQLLALWVNRVAYSAALEELDKVIGRSKNGPRSFGPLEIEHANGTVKHVLDRAENRDAAIRNGYATVGQTNILKQLVYRDILGKLFANATGSKRQLDGIKLLQMMLRNDLTDEEIAAQQGMKKAAVSSLLRSARKKLRVIAETKYNFTVNDL
jgi:hypothetical protein